MSLPLSLRAREGLLYVALATALSTSACLRPKGLRSTPAPRGCASDSDCSAARNEVCRLADGSVMHTAAPAGKATTTGTCVIPATGSTRQIYLEIHPVGNTSTLPVQMPPISLSAGQNQSFAVPLPVNVNGAVVEGGTQRPVAQANVHFRLIPTIPNRPQFFDATTLGDGTFSRPLPKGVSYTVTVDRQAPDSTPAPLEVFPNVHVDANGQLAAFTTTDPADIAFLNGTLLTDGSSGPRFLSGMGVLALAASTDATSSRSVVSETAHTAQDGTFRLALSKRLITTPGTTWPVQLQVAPLSATALMPTFLGLSPVDVLNMLSFSTPLVLPGAPVTVHGTVLAPDGSPVGGAQVSLKTTDSAQTSSGKFSFSTTTTTLADGSFQVPVLPADYTVLAQQPPDVTGMEPVNLGLCGLTPGGQGTTLHADANSPNAVILGCENRQWTAGQVQASNGQTVPDVVVVATRRPTPALSDAVLFQTTTDENGVFWLPLVSGTYDINLQPSAGSKLPFTWAPAAIEAGDDVPAHLPILVLAAPFELFGAMVSDGTDHAPVEALIEAYAAETTTTVLIGRGQSSSDGKYSIILPSASPVTSTAAQPVSR
jgi:hypothetical protein